MLLAKNKKALFDHEIVEKFIAGIQLKGYEVKAIREGKATFEGSYVKVIGNEAVLVNVAVGTYSKQSQEISSTEATRSRKLLLNKAEIRKIQQELQQKGRTAVPLALILRQNLVKLEFAIVKGLKKHERKHLEKERQVKKDLERDTKAFRSVAGAWD